jgi:hypothetical protein
MGEDSVPHVSRARCRAWHAVGWRCAVAGVAAATLAGCGAVSSWTPSAAADGRAAIGTGNNDTLIFSYKSYTPQHATVPAGITYAWLDVTGGRGGATSQGISYHVNGGDAMEVEGVYPVHAGQVLDLIVAGAGASWTGGGPSDGTRGGYGNYGGGNGGSASGTGRGGAGGGGASSVWVNGSIRVIVAPGGGGAGGPGLTKICCNGGFGGSANATGPETGSGGKGAGSGHGGTGGSELLKTGGNGGNGGSGGGGGGGGGGGYYASGSGGSGGRLGGGGGGGGGAGERFYDSRLTDVRLLRGVTTDGNGRIVITWMTRPCPPTIQCPT